MPGFRLVFGEMKPCLGRCSQAPNIEHFILWRLDWRDWESTRDGSEQRVIRVSVGSFSSFFAALAGCFSVLSVK